MLNVTQTSPETFPSTNVLFQTPLWGKIKSCAGQKTLYFWADWQFDGTGERFQKIFPLLVFLRNAYSDYMYAYIPRSPPFALRSDLRGILLEEIAFALKPYLPKHIICVRFDSAWIVDKINEDSELRLELREIKMNFGTKTHSLRKASSNYLCHDSVIIDLRLPPERLLMNMRQTTRNSIRKAYKTGVCFSIYDSRSPDIFIVLEKWYVLYKETAERKGFFCGEYDYFTKLFSVRIENTDECSGIFPMAAQVPPPRFYLFTAHKENTILSGLILAVCGSAAYYMYAASSLEGRECMPNYGLQWEVMRFARSQGCVSYDLMGIPPNGKSEHPMAGLYIFKTGFGGRKVKFCGTWDFPYDTEAYERFKNAESISR